MTPRGIRPITPAVPRTTETIVLRIAGQPAGKQRPRFDPRSKRTYTPKATVASENEIRSVWREAGEPRLPDGTAIAIELALTVTRPASHHRRDGALSAEGLRHPVPCRKPDVDNTLKLCMDALNGRAYRDDVQIADATVRRRWGIWPETLITLRPVSQTEED